MGEEKRSMMAIEIGAFGPPEGLKKADRPIPQPGPGEVLIKVVAAGVNRPDIMQRTGNYPPPAGVTDIPGLEVAGTIITLGQEVLDWKVGDSVCALVSGGGYAEYCVASELLCLPIPDGLTMVEAAAIPETFFTVWTNVFQSGRLASGDSILVHGGASGIGTTAIQLASAFGARVFATAGNLEKCKACENLGAEYCVNYKEEDFVGVIKKLTDDKGVDVVLDMVGGDYFMRNIDVLAIQGRLVQIAVLNGPKVQDFNILPMMMKRLVLTGSTLRPRSVEQKASIAKCLREHVWPLLESGLVRPKLDLTFPLADAAAAHGRMEASAHIGKIMLVL